MVQDHSVNCSYIQKMLKYCNTYHSTSAFLALEEEGLDYFSTTSALTRVPAVTQITDVYKCARYSMQLVL